MSAPEVVKIGGSLAYSVPLLGAHARPLQRDGRDA